MWLISIVATIFTLIAFNISLDIYEKYKTNQYIELLEDHLIKEHSTDKWIVENMGTVGRKKTFEFHVIFEDEPQYRYVYLIDDQTLKQYSYRWNQEFVDESIYSPTHLETP